MNNWYTYDIETYPNVFTLATKNYHTGNILTFEWSARKCEIPQLINFILTLKATGAAMVGYNSLGFDYPVLHYILNNYPNITVADVYTKADSIINAPHDKRFAHMVWDRDRLVRQIDLFKINHFDNVAKFTSLKMLEFNMRSGCIQDLPYTPGVPLTLDQIDPLIEYNIKDVNETELFLKECLPAIELRESLSTTHFNGHDIINHNDTKIGKDYLIKQLGEEVCYTRDASNRRKPRQTPRPEIVLGDVILPYVRFDHPEFNRILQWFNDRVITETKGSIKDLSCTIEGFQFDFGTGGIHGSIESAVVQSSDTHVIIDIDVASYYPNLAIVNRLFPEHLGNRFCDVYKDVYEQRKQHAKGTPENAVFKLALNGTYGDSNNQYSPFYDPKFTMAITINGQLSLCMIAEQMMKVPGLQMIQINTDGLTMLVPRQYVGHTRSVCKWWEDVTGLELEEAVYSRMMIRDVNNYISEYEGTGKLKLKGAYGYKLQWHQNHSALVVPKAAEAYLVHGIDPARFLREHDDIMDFMLRTKVPRSSRLELDGVQVQNITRYYISNQGGSLIKIMPPLAKNPTKERPIGINVGWKVTECNDIRGVSEFDINYNWYLEEVNKLLMG